jgi:hypothetical protein
MHPEAAKPSVLLTNSSIFTPSCLLLDLAFSIPSSRAKGSKPHDCSLIINVGYPLNKRYRVSTPERRDGESPNRCIEGDGFVKMHYRTSHRVG